MSVDREAALTAKLREWCERPQIKQAGWAPRLFWNCAADGTPQGALRVDPWELEVFFAALLEESSDCAEDLETLRPGRSAFLTANARRHELPLFTFLR